MLFRSNVNVNYNIPIDISNIKLYGPLAYNYQISNFTTISGLISKRYLYTTGIDKNYDRSLLANVSISNIVGDDSITYFAQYDDYNVGSNKVYSVLEVLDIMKEIAQYLAPTEFIKGKLSGAMFLKY